MKTAVEFLTDDKWFKKPLTEKEKEIYLKSIITHEDYIKAMKEYALEIANEAFDEGFTYGIGSHKDFIQTGLNKFEYLQKLHNEL